MSRAVRFALGIDGGASHTRAVVVTPDLVVRGSADGSGANPGVVGPDIAANAIRDVSRRAVAAAGVHPEQIAWAGIGVAGAAASHSADWLRTVVAEVVPRAQIFPSADYEIALVGALGERRGVLVLSGTGSFAFGVNARGESALAGAWGYLIDDPGSGYWIGTQALEAIVRAADGRAADTTLREIVLHALGLAEPRDLIGWLYHAGRPLTPEIAGLAPLVLNQAAAGDAAAAGIVQRARDELLLMVGAVMRRLTLETPPVAFGGGLLAVPNPLSDSLRAALGLTTFPQPLYPPVVGAALLALQEARP